MTSYPTHRLIGRSGAHVTPSTLEEVALAEYNGQNGTVWEPVSEWAAPVAEGRVSVRVGQTTRIIEPFATDLVGSVQGNLLVVSVVTDFGYGRIPVWKVRSSEPTVEGQDLRLAALVQAYAWTLDRGLSVRPDRTPRTIRCATEADVVQAQQSAGPDDRIIRTPEPPKDGYKPGGTIVDPHVGFSLRTGKVGTLAGYNVFGTSTDQSRWVSLDLAPTPFGAGEIERAAKARLRADRMNSIIPGSAPVAAWDGSKTNPPCAAHPTEGLVAPAPTEDDNEDDDGDDLPIESPFVVWLRQLARNYHATKTSTPDDNEGDSPEPDCAA